MKAKVSYIEKLIEQGEHLHQDFKFAINDSRKIARSLVAFSNTGGGRLLIGVKDNGVVCGVRTDEEFYMIQAAADLYCKPSISFETVNWNVNGKRVLEIIIPKSARKPHFALSEDKKWLAYIRVADQNILANAIQLKVWDKLKSKSGIKIDVSEPGKKLLNFLNANEFISLTGFLKLAKISYAKGVTILSDFIVLDFIEQDFINNAFVYKLKK